MISRTFFHPLKSAEVHLAIPRAGAIVVVLGLITTLAPQLKKIVKPPEEPPPFSTPVSAPTPPPKATPQTVRTAVERSVWTPLLRPIRSPGQEERKNEEESKYVLMNPNSTEKERRDLYRKTAKEKAR